MSGLPIMEEFLRHTPVCSAVLDSDWRILDANVALCELFGLADGALKGRLISEFIDSAAVMDALVRYSNSKVACGASPELRYITAQGEKGWCLLAIGHLSSDTPTSHRFILQLADITARRAREEALTLVHRTAQQMSVARNEFMRNLSHELRTPLNGVFGMVELLTQSQLGPEQQAHLDTLRTSALRLSSRVDDLLDLAALESGQLTLSPAVVDLPAECDALEGLLSTQLSNAEVSFEFATQPGLPRFVQIDARRMRQVITALTSNAFKFTERGVVSVDLAWRAPNLLEITVSDTGPGIPHEKLETIFDEFGQIDGSMTRRYGGLGIGLTVARRLSQTMGGNIQVSSRVGEGSVFRCTLSAPVQVLSSSDTHPNDLPLAGVRVLLAEDDPTNQLVIRKLLEREGASLTVVEDGHKAVEAFDETRYDVALLDIQMPVLTGLEVADRIAARVYPRRFPMIATTAHHSEEARLECERHGISGFVSKPMSRAALLYEVQRATSRATKPFAEKESKSRPSPAIDWQRLGQLFSSDSSEMVELLRALLTSLLQHSEALKLAATQKDSPQVVRAAHSLRGTVASVGNAAAADLARKVELSAKGGEVDGQALSLLYHEVDRIRLEVQEGLEGART